MKVEIYTTYKKKIFPKKKFPGFNKEGPRKWGMHLPAKEARKTVKNAENLGLYARCFDERYDRSANYRKEFIKANPSDKYRCVYCGKVIKKEKMVVDHVIPIAKAKVSKKYQKKLSTKDGVNDVSNLVPSCMRCNSRKGTSDARYWRIKATVGKSDVYWGIRKLILLVIITIVVAIICGSRYANMSVYDFLLMGVNYVKQIL